MFDGRTPQDLMQSGIYSNLALALYPGPYFPVSVALVAGRLGAADAWLWGAKFCTAKATRLPISGKRTFPREKTLPRPLTMHVGAQETPGPSGAATPLLRDTLTVEEEESARVLLRSLSAPGTPG